MQQLWILFCFGTVLCWGAYGPTLHTGTFGFGNADRANNSFRAMLCVGGAYMLIAVLLPVLMLIIQGKLGGFNAKGTLFSTFAGCLGALGATCIIYSFKNGGKPIVVMALVFGLAPIVNAVISSITHPPEGGWKMIDFRVYIGTLMAAVGGYLVMRYKDVS